MNDGSNSGARTSLPDDDDHTKAQFKEFANRHMTDGKSKGKACPFYITIPKGSEALLEKVLTEMGLDKKGHVNWQAFEI